MRVGDPGSQLHKVRRPTPGDGWVEGEELGPRGSSCEEIEDVDLLASGQEHLLVQRRTLPNCLQVSSFVT